MNQSWFRDFFGFRFITLCGLLISFIVWSKTSEKQPLSSFLFSPTLYIIAIIVAVTFHILIWLIIYKGSSYEFGYQIKNTIKDCVIITAVILSSLGCLFLLNSFLL